MGCCRQSTIKWGFPHQKNKGFHAFAVKEVSGGGGEGAKWLVPNSSQSLGDWENSIGYWYFKGRIFIKSSPYLTPTDLATPSGMISRIVPKIQKSQGLNLFLMRTISSYWNGNQNGPRDLILKLKKYSLLVIHSWVLFSINFPCLEGTVKVMDATYLGIRNAHKRVWLVERKSLEHIWRWEISNQREVICTYANSCEISQT